MVALPLIGHFAPIIRHRLMRHLFACWITLLVWSVGAPLLLWGQSGVTESLGIREGLSQGYVSCVLIDGEGFLWAGTKNGLNRYDGRQFRVFTHDPADPYSISNDYIISLSEYRDFLLVGTNGGGLNIYDKRMQRFYRVPDQLPDGERLPSPIVFKTAVDALGNIWLNCWKERTFTAGPLVRLRVPADFWTRLADARGRWAGIAVEARGKDAVNVLQLSRDKQSLWLADSLGVYRLDVRTDALDSVALPVQARFPLLLLDSADQVWLHCDSQLLRVSGRQACVVPTDFQVQHHFGFDRENRILLGAADGSLLRIPVPADLCNAGLKRRAADLRADAGQGVQAVVDASNIIWLRTIGYGLKKINPRHGLFRTSFTGRSVYAPPFCLPDGTVVFFDFKDGPLLEPSGSLHPIARLLRTLPELTTTTRMLRDCEENYWFFYLNNRQVCLIKSDAQGKNLQRFVLKQSPDFGGSIALDAQCTVWVAQNGLLARFDPVSGQFVRYPYSNLLPFGHEVRTLVQTGNGHWWLATDYGLVEATPEGAGFSFFLHKNDPNNPNSLRNENLAALRIDPKDPNLLWIPTKGGGLDRLNIRTGQWTHLTAKDGLPNEVIYGILDDADGNLWMSSNAGLIRYNPLSGAIKNFTEEDGLQGNEFNTWAYGKTASGELMFGGTNGLNIFNPTGWQDNHCIPRVYITGLKVNNKTIAPGDSSGLLSQALEYHPHITLPYGQNSIALQFAALEFSVPAKNRFRYYLEGAEAEWAHESSDPSAQYLNLQPGHYTFKVMGSNNDRVWNNTPTTLDITVLPPWYRSVWAWLLYVLLLGGLVYGYLRFRINRLRLQQRLDLEYLKAERLKEVDEFKSRFFTNISHEFRTPLTVILGTADQLNEAAGRAEAGQPDTNFLLSKIALLRRNGQNLLRLVNQILDLAKLENNALKINYIRGDVLAYLRYVAESLHSLANAKNVLLRVESPSAAIDMDYDPERLMQIVHNLLSNAIKFTPSGGRIVLRAEERAAETGPRLYLRVTDSGAGIPPEDLPRIFDRFFQANNQGHSQSGGTGIGLSLTKELVKAMGGEISVASTVGQGAVFSVELPITRNVERSEIPAPAGAESGIRNAESGFRNAEFLDGGEGSFSAFPAPDDPLKVHSRNPDSAIPRLLLIEDNPDVVEYLASCLQGMDGRGDPRGRPRPRPRPGEGEGEGEGEGGRKGRPYVLEFAYNGRAGIEKALETVPDIIISDVMMPEKDGFEVCETLKNDERTSHIPIVLLTAKAGVEDRIAGLRRGADAYLAKPFHPEELRVTLLKLLELRQRLQARYAGAGPLPPAETEAVQQEDAFLQKLRAAAESRLGDPGFSGEELCRAVGMSYPVVYRKLSALTGRSLNLYIRLLRLEKACDLLRSSALSIAEIAYETGFNDPKFFSRVFSEEYGMPPSVFREKENK